MDRSAKPATAKVTAKRPTASKGSTPATAEVRALEQRLAAALEQQAATNEILRVMAVSRDDVQPVLDAVAEQAARLCKAPYARIFLVEGDALRIAADYSLAREIPIPVLPVPLRRSSVSGRAVIDAEIVHHADVTHLLDTEFPDTRDNAQLIGCRAVLAVPLMREGSADGAIFLWRREPGLFAPDEVALVQTFARQAAIAIENTRLFAELQIRNHDISEALEQQTATSDILRVISSSPTEVQPVFNAIARDALRLCDADYSVVGRYDGEMLHLVAHEHVRAEGVQVMLRLFPLAPNRATTMTRAILDRTVVHVPDVLEDPDYDRTVALGITNRSTLGVPMLRDGNPIGSISVGRLQPRPFTDKQIALVQTFADQAVIAIENVRLFKELEAKNRDLTEALEQQTATSEILRVISQSQTNVQPVFDTIAQRAGKLCDAEVAVVSRFDGTVIELAAIHGLVPEGVKLVRGLYPMKIDAQTVTSRVIRNNAVIHYADVLAEPSYEIKDFARAARYRSALGVPIVRNGKVIGSIFVGRLAPGHFSDSQIELLKTFSEQAVIAIENVRLFTELGNRNRDLTEALEQQNATSEVLNVISRSPTDVQPVFDTIAQSALTLCRASAATLLTYDGTLIHLASAANVKAEADDAIRKLFPRPPSKDTAGTRAILTRRVVVIPDVLEDSNYSIGSASHFTGFRSVTAVPLIRDDLPIGAIAVGRPEPGPFSEKQIALLQTFADQAVIAIENVRLFTELEARNKDLTQSLEQQTATSEILRAISQSQTDVRPVFDTIAQRAGKLCDAEVAVVSRFDGSVIELAAIDGVVPDAVKIIRDVYPLRIDSHTVSARVIRSGAVVHYADVLADPSYATKEFARAARYRGALGVPIIRDAKVIGSIFVGRSSPGLFSESQIELLKTFSEQAVIAIENVRLFKELEARTTQLTRSVGELKALGEVGQAVSSTLDLETVLRTIVARATELAGMDGGSIYEYDEAREVFHLHTTDRLPTEVVEALSASPIPKGEGALGQLAVTGDVVAIRDITDETVYRSRVRKMLLRTGYRSLLAVPLLRENHLLGGLVVNRKTPGEFAPEVIDLLKAFATQSALAIQNARLFREIGDKSRELEIASRHKSEFLANMSHELRTPLNAIIGFSEVLADRMFGEINDKQAEYLADILESGRHLLSLINDILDLSKIEAGRMELDLDEFNLPTVIENTVTLIRERAHRRGITLERAIGERVGVVRADERKVKQVLLNLLSNALKFTPEGGRISVRSDVRDGVAEVSVTDTGIGIAASDQATVFEEFRQVGTTAKKVEGTGLGLAISRKFIELHGGTLWVKSDVGVGSTFAFTLPILDRAR